MLLQFYGLFLISSSHLQQLCKSLSSSTSSSQKFLKMLLQFYNFSFIFSSHLQQLCNFVMQSLDIIRQLLLRLNIMGDLSVVEPSPVAGETSPQVTSIVEQIPKKYHQQIITSFCKLCLSFSFISLCLLWIEINIRQNIFHYLCLPYLFIRIPFYVLSVTKPMKYQNFRVATLSASYCYLSFSYASIFLLLPLVCLRSFDTKTPDCDWGKYLWRYH